MKIILCCRTYPTQRPGGMPFVCQDRAHALAGVGHEVHVLTTGTPQGGALAMGDGDVTVHHLDCPPQQYTARFAEECETLCRRLRPDILHLDSFDRDHLWWASRPGGPKTVAITMHGFGPGAFLTQWNLFLGGGGVEPSFQAAEWKKEAAGLRQADRLLAISRQELWMLQDIYNLYDKAALVYNPIAPCFFEGINPPPPMSGPLIAVGNPGTNGNRGHSIAQEAARKMGMGFSIIKGARREELPEIYRKAKALILPTYWAQGYDLTVAEALACQRPVLVSSTGSYLREAEGNPNLVVVPRGGAEVWAGVLGQKLPIVPVGAADRHRPDEHIKNWLEALKT